MARVLQMISKDLQLFAKEVVCPFKNIVNVCSVQCDTYYGRKGQEIIA